MRIKFFVSFYQEKRKYKAKVVKLVEKEGIAVLKIIGSGRRLLPIKRGDSSQVRVGEKALAMGSPFEQNFSLSLGIISGVGREFKSVDGSVSAIQTDAAINSGSYGGALFNSAGEVIGMNIGIKSKVKENNGIGFAIPINELEEIVKGIVL